MHLRPWMGVRWFLQLLTVVTLVAATLAAFWFTRTDARSELHRQRVQAARQLSLEINARISKSLGALNGIYGLKDGLPDFSRGRFVGFGRGLERGLGFAYVGWAPAVEADKQDAFARQHRLRIAGAGETAEGMVVPVLYAVQARQGQVAHIRPGLNLLSSPDIRPALVESTRTKQPGVSGAAQVSGAAGVVLLQPMFIHDAAGERIGGWAVAGLRADRLVGASVAVLPPGAVARVALGDTVLFGPPKAGERKDTTSTAVGRSTWKISISGIGGRFVLLLPWIVLAIGVALTALVAFLFRQATRLDRARRAELARLQQAALVDSLTGLRNHRAFQEDLARELKRQSRSGAPLSLVMIDLNGLKEINDTLGHQEGDERLKSLATSLHNTARASDTSYRLGGDEFTLLLAEADAWQAFQFVQRLQQRLKAAPEHKRIGIAAGVAETMGLEARDAFTRRASLALAAAKRFHRGVLVYSREFEPAERQLDQESEEHHTRTLASALARAVDAKDSYTRSHCETVSQLCVMIGEQLDFAPDRIAKLRLAGLLHDVGKIGIPDAILQKPAKLTDDEFEIMKTHPGHGHNIVSAAERDEEAMWILHHHERPDGRGYPEGLRGNEIPLESRIILVADAFEAITADRPYRKHASVDAALEELDRHAGTQFDPECVTALQSAIGRHADVWSQEPTAAVMSAA